MESFSNQRLLESTTNIIGVKLLVFLLITNASDETMPDGKCHIENQA